MMVKDWHMVRHEGLVLRATMVRAAVVRATVVPQARKFDVVAWVADTEDDCKDGDEDDNPKESWDNA